MATILGQEDLTAGLGESEISIYYLNCYPRIQCYVAECLTEDCLGALTILARSFHSCDVLSTPH